METLAAGNGYWVKSNGSGRLMLSSHFPARSTGIKYAQPAVSLRFEDADQNRAMLSLSESGMEGSGELPPVPPDEQFDVRYASQRYIEFFDIFVDSVRRYPIDIQTRSHEISLSWVSTDPVIDIALEDSKGSVRNFPASTGSITLECGRVKHFVLIVTRRFTNDHGYALMQNYPNPFNPSTSFSLVVPRSENVELRVYDASGREIKTLLNRTMSEGKFSVMWDGSTDRGEPAGSGVYFVRMKAGTYSAVRKVVLIK